MAIVAKKGDNDVNKAEYDNTGKIWAKAWLTATNSYPTISGNLERLQAGNDAGACLFVANHASWLDIPVLCTVLDPVFKFIAKGELSKVPCIGQQLAGVRTSWGSFNFLELASIVCWNCGQPQTLTLHFLLSRALTFLLLTHLVSC